MPEEQPQSNAPSAGDMITSAFKMKKVYGKGVNELSARGRKRKMKRKSKKPRGYLYLFNEKEND